MDFVGSQNILLVLLKIFGFFPMNFVGKFRKFTNYLYNFCVSVALISIFTILGSNQLDQGLVFTTAKNSAFAYLNAMMTLRGVDPISTIYIPKGNH
jgi:hypothetical protein